MAQLVPHPADPGLLLLRTSFAETDAASLIPGARWKKDHDGWEMPARLPVCYFARGVFRARLEVHPAVQEWARQWQAAEAPLRDLQTSLLGELTTPGRPEARPYQRLCSEFARLSCLLHGGVVIEDEPGLGKTLEAIDALVGLGPDALPAVVVCPKSVVGAWAAELAKWAPHLRVAVATGSASKRKAALELLEPALEDAKGTRYRPERRAGERAADVAILGWGSLMNHSRSAPFGSRTLSEAEKRPGDLDRIKPATIIGDEAHRVKDPAARRTRAFWNVCDKARYRILLTGTPVSDSPIDLWSLLRSVDERSFPSRTKYINRYLECTENWFGGLPICDKFKPDVEPEIRRTLDVWTIRRTKDMVAPDLPPKIWYRREVEMPPKARKAYDDMRERLVAELDDGTQMVAVNPLTKATRLIQLASATVLLADPDVPTTSRYQLAEPSWKVDDLVELLEDVAPEQAVVFAASSMLIGLASHRLSNPKPGEREVPHGLIVGGVSEAARAEAVERFQAGELRLVLATLGAGGEGITLTAARHIVFLQRSWSVRECLQATDRVHRIGSERHEAIGVHDIMTVNTVDDRVLDVLHGKGETAEAVLRDRAQLARVLREGLDAIP